MKSTASIVLSVRIATRSRGARPRDSKALAKRQPRSHICSNVKNRPSYRTALRVKKEEPARPKTSRLFMAEPISYVRTDPAISHGAPCHPRPYGGHQQPVAVLQASLAVNQIEGDRNGRAGDVAEARIGHDPALHGIPDGCGELLDDLPRCLVRADQVDLIERDSHPLENLTGRQAPAIAAQLRD